VRRPPSPTTSSKTPAGSDTVHDHARPDGTPLPYQAACCTAIDTVLKAATKETAEAETADRQYQALLAKVRDTGRTFDVELQAMRRIMSVVAGRNDKDFQKLRAQRAQLPDEEDDPAAPPAPSGVPPAPAGTNTPVAPA
jgi:hypothetical protein